jgi:transcriptional regulator with XRE-family HTH domain
LKTLHSKEYNVFIKHLVAARRESGLTQQQLATRLSKPQSYVSKYERGERRLDVVEFVLISDALGMDPCSVFEAIRHDLSESRTNTRDQKH